jgi:hypothetical protein
MALVNCKECAKEISSEASSCPNCGAPVLKKRSRSIAPGFIIFAALVLLLSMCSGNEKKADKHKCEKNDLACRGNNAIVLGGIACKAPIERHAKFNYRWIDGTLESKFSHYRWTDRNQELITIIGDKAEFQNGFGAYIRVTYECDLANDDQTALSVRVKHGKI